MFFFSRLGADVVSVGVDSSGTGYLFHGTNTAAKTFVSDSDQTNLLISATQSSTGTSVRFYCYYYCFFDCFLNNNNTNK